EPHETGPRLSPRGPGRDRRLLRLLGLAEAGSFAVVAGAGRTQPDRLRRAADAGPGRGGGAGVRGLWRGLYRGVAGVDGAGREDDAGPLGCHRRRGLPDRRGDHSVGAEGL
ncbi:hypothetical protein LTR94_033278, partial [Friedmanniomyces endolithicus]